MSYIENTRMSPNFAYEITVCITKGECKVLLPLLKKACKETKIKFDKYEDIHDSGEATEKQENMRAKYADELESLESILSDIHTILK
ncbi:hypothetical protein [uncultured Bacteroides sp.]|uniref:hypothetical protein n=1 Tax=uncultured Bacteroides sp. TaxID=162156 RepID=UPI002AAB7776|nr:hypothetical protein [uncultured Bacteroides sp.]